MSSWCVHVGEGCMSSCNGAHMRGRGVCRLGAYVRGCMSS